jgi:hypothetical protein
MKTRIAIPVAAVALLALGYFVSGPSARKPANPAQPSAASGDEPRLAPKPSARAGLANVAAPPEQAAAPLPTPAVASADEEELMVVLRHSWPMDPLGSLEEAQAAEQRFPNSPHSPERRWIVVRSLVELKRFQEARKEAEIMVARFPNNSWASDAQRHLLVHPLGQPSREEQQKLD